MMHIPVGQLLFAAFAALVVLSALAVVFSRNPVHSVLFLILTFVNAAGLFLLANAEFLAMILIIVYVGAVAVLFLFVVMMLDVDFAAMRTHFRQNLPISLLLSGILLVQLLLLAQAWHVDGGVRVMQGAEMVKLIEAAKVPNATALGAQLYTKYMLVFQASGLVLLVAMLGAITLTLRQRGGVRRQKISVQNARDPRKAIDVRTDVVSGKGIG